MKSLEERLANTNELITDTRNSDEGKILALKQQVRRDVQRRESNCFTLSVSVCPFHIYSSIF